MPNVPGFGLFSTFMRLMATLIGLQDMPSGACPEIGTADNRVGWPGCAYPPSARPRTPFAAQGRQESNELTEVLARHAGGRIVLAVRQCACRRHPGRRVHAAAEDLSDRAAAWRHAVRRTNQSVYR